MDYTVESHLHCGVGVGVQLVAPWMQLFRVKTDEEGAEVMRQMIVAADALEGGLKECSGGKGPFFGAESVGYVDVLLGGMVSWLKATEVVSGAKIIDAARTPLLAAWMERFWELDAARALLQDVSALVGTEYARAVQARFCRRSSKQLVMEHLDPA